MLQREAQANMKQHHASAFVFLVLFGALGFWASADLDAQRLPVFPYTGGWLGADGAYSIPLRPDKSLWLFGDTLVGDPGTTLRAHYKAMVRNSIGIGTCEPEKPCTIHYYWRNPDSAKPRSFFDTGKDDVWYWPLDGYLDGYLDGGTLYLSLMVVRNRPGASSKDALGFEVVGTKWASVTNLSAPPDRWKISLRDMTGGDMLPGVSIVANGSFLLLYTHVTEAQGRGYIALLRVPRNKIADPASHWEYLGRDSKWRPGTPHGDALHVIDQPISEMSVRYHPQWKEWVAISAGPGATSNHIVARIAGTPLGPWSDPINIFQFLEMTPDREIYDHDTFCYAAKEHIEFEESNLVVTYACNSFSFEKVINNMAIYRPQVVVLQRPQP
jgi:hypothetical protein